MWSTFGEQKWVNFGEPRGPPEGRPAAAAAAAATPEEIAGLPPVQAEFARLSRTAVEAQRLGRELEAIDYLKKTLDVAAASKGGIPVLVEFELLFRLAVAYMRDGETQNCVRLHGVDSCIFPLRGDGIYRQQERSRQAIDTLTVVLRAALDGTPRHLEARWLLNFAYMTLGAYPDEVPKAYLIPPEAFRSDEDFPRFVNVAPRLGLDAFNLAGGAIVDDFDNDGYLDIVISNWDPKGQLRLFRNNRDGSFTERTDQAGPQGLFGGLNLIQADYNNDGHVDIFVLRGGWLQDNGRHPDSLLRNNGNGTFTDVTIEAGLGEVHYPSHSASWGDYGFLDFYLGTGQTAYEEIMPNLMYRNQGGKRFADITSAGGFGHLQKGHGVAFADLDHDGDEDVFEQMGGAQPGDGYHNVLYQNPGFGNHWITIKAVGVRSNRSAIGARIRADIVEDGHRRPIYRYVNSGGSFGANPLRQTIGLGKAKRIETLEVFWPTSNITQTFHGVPVDRAIQIVEAEKSYTVLPLKSFAFGGKR
jgi:hypothetical protein